MKALPLLLTIGLLSIGLEEPVKKISIDPENDPETKIFISDLASDIRYVKLETNPDCMLDLILKVVTDQDLIFIHSHTNPSGYLFIFSNTGKFIRQIGKQGRGPGEYSSISDFTIDRINKRIYLLDSMGNLFIYSFSGEFINKENIKSRPSSIVYFNKQLFFLQCWPTYFQNNGMALTIKDLNHKKSDVTLLNRRYIKFDKTKQNVLYYPNHTFTAQADNSITLLECKFDTLYSISAEGDIQPKYVIDLKNKMPQNLFFINEYDDAIKKYGNYDQIIETSQYIFLKVLHKSEFYLYLYNKTDGKLLKQNTNKLTQYIYNDYDGGLSYSFKGLADLNVAYCIQSSTRLKNKLSQESKTMIKNPKANSYLKELVRDSDENDNPTLVFITLKP